jgi:hypothetical protein
MTLQETKEARELRSIVEINISDFHDEFLIALLGARHITDSLKDIVTEELRTRGQRLQDAIIEREDDVPRCADVPGFASSIDMLNDLFNLENK